MAQYTRSAAEQFRPEEAAVGWLWNIFVFSVVVFGSVVLLYVGMEFGYKSFLNKQITQVQSDIDAKKGQISAEDQAHLGQFYSQVYNVNKLLVTHPAVSKILSFIETNTNKAVSYNRFSYTKTSNSVTVTVGAQTASMDLVAKQLESFRQRPEVLEVSLNNATEDQGKINFGVRILLDPKFLNSN